MAAITTIDFTNLNSVDSVGMGAETPIQKLELVVDTNASNTNGQEIAAGDFPLFDIPGGWMHLGTTVEVLVAEGGTATFGIGITGALETFMAAAACNLNAAVGTIVTDVDAANASGGAAGGYVTAAAGITVRGDTQNAMNLGKFRIVQLWADMNGGGTKGGVNNA